MTPRIRLLLLIGLGAFGVIQLSGPVVDTVYGPLSSLQKRVADLDAGIEKKQSTQRRILQATKDLKVWNTRSLPPSQKAASLYQAWLIELATRAKLNNVTVNPGRVDNRPKADTYYSIPATVKGEGTLKQVCDFLYEYHRSGLLHRVNSVHVESSKHQGDPVVEMTVEVEGVSLVNAKSRTTVASADLKPAEIAPREEYDDLTKKNLFVRGYNGPPPPPRTEQRPPTAIAQKPAEPPLDSKEFVRLVASVASAGQPEVWLYDNLTNTQTVLNEGSSFKVAGVEGVVLVIASDFVQLQIARDTYELELGQNLNEMRKVATAAPKPAPDVKPADAKPAEATPAETKPAEAEPKASKPAETKPAEPKSGDVTPAEEKPADPK